MAFRRLNSLSAATYRHVLPRRGVNHVPAGYGQVVLVTRFRDLQLLTPPGVFAPRSDALMLIDAASGRLHGDVLDVCAGSGVLGLSAAPAARSVTAVDVSRLAVWTVRANARLNRRRVETRRGDLFAPVAGRRFDIILSNPPYLPTPARQRPRLAAWAWEGGPDGRALIDRICRGAREHLRPGGDVFLVHSSVCGIEPSLDLLERSGLEAEIVSAHQGPLGPLARARITHLRQLDVLDENDTERIVVVRGRNPNRGRRAPGFDAHTAFSSPAQ